MSQLSQPGCQIMYKMSLGKGYHLIECKEHNLQFVVVEIMEVNFGSNAVFQSKGRIFEYFCDYDEFKVWCN